MGTSQTRIMQPVVLRELIKAYRQTDVAPASRRCMSNRRGRDAGSFVSPFGRQAASASHVRAASTSHAGKFVSPRLLSLARFHLIPLRTSSLVTFALCFSLLLPAVAEETLLLHDPNHHGLTIVASQDSPGVRRAAESLETFLRDRAIRDARIIRQPDVLPDASIIALETIESSPIAHWIGEDVSGFENARPEAHRIVARVHGDHPLILVVGRTDRGVDAGAAYLLSKLLWQDGVLRIPPISETRSPFFVTREATLCPTGRILTQQPDLMRKVNYEHWSREQLERYPRYLRACGFNSVQIMELLGFGTSRGYREGGDRARIAPVLHTLADAAHREGLLVSQYIWGSADGLRWDKPADRPERERRYRELAETYGKHVDHVVTHWIDEGYEGGYVIPQAATTVLLNEYRKHNPKIQATVDVWGNKDFWDSDPRAKSFLDETYSPREIGIALERWYNADQARKIRDAGRRVGIWGWYLGDYEMVYGSHLQGRVLDKYFSALPREASELVDWLSIELCFHALPSEINLYIAGRKMWEPARPLSEIMLDYCRSVYGPVNASAMHLAYKVAEEGQVDVKTYGFFIPHSDRFPDVRGTPAFRKRLEQALAAIERIKLPDDWRANFPTVAQPGEDVQSLRDTLTKLWKESGGEKAE